MCTVHRVCTSASVTSAAGNSKNTDVNGDKNAGNDNSCMAHAWLACDGEPVLVPLPDVVDALLADDSGDGDAMVPLALLLLLLDDEEEAGVAPSDDGAVVPLMAANAPVGVGPSCTESKDVSQSNNSAITSFYVQPINNGIMMTLRLQACMCSSVY